MAGRKPRTSPAPADAPYALADLAQIRALADPLRLRILSTLGVERTTKQVAEILGEKPTKLYHHVAALERVGLVRLARKRPNRGTVEKYFVAVARAFKADARVFSPPGSRAAAPALTSMVSSALETTASEIERLVTVETGGSALEEEGVVTFLEVRASAAEIRRLRGKIGRLIEGLRGKGTGAAARDRRYRLTIAFFPLDVAERAGE